jgi:putative transposase
MERIGEERGFYGLKAICGVLGVAPASYYRWQRHGTGPRKVRRHPRALSDEERQGVVAVLNEERFCDQAPAEVYATLLDEGSYLCSERTMYRILVEQHEVRERRDQLRHPSYAAPELIATRPNEVWSWDITKLLGPSKWTYYYLYVILDIFSRYVVGWMLAYRETAVLATRLIDQSVKRQGVVPGELTLHADRGSGMTSKAVAWLLAELGVTKTHSRPHVSNDNPYSESQYKTMKYRPEFPDRFGCFEDGRSFCGEFFHWYNDQHHHSGLGYLTPHEVHVGLAEQHRQERSSVLQEAFEKNPERFIRGLPKPPALPEQVWINKPKEITTSNQNEPTSAEKLLVGGHPGPHTVK